MSKIAIDMQEIHADDLGGMDNHKIIGYFRGTPIIEWNPQDTAKRNDTAMRARILRSKQQERKEQ